MSILSDKMKVMLKFSSAKIRLLIYQILAIIPFVIFIFYLFDLWYETSKQAVLNENYNHAKMVSLYISDSFRYGLDTTENLAETLDLTLSNLPADETATSTADFLIILGADKSNL